MMMMMMMIPIIKSPNTSMGFCETFLTTISDDNELRKEGRKEILHIFPIKLFEIFLHCGIKVGHIF
jgi:hypothetical protein